MIQKNENFQLTEKIDKEITLLRKEKSTLEAELEELNKSLDNVNRNNVSNLFATAVFLYISALRGLFQILDKDRAEALRESLLVVNKKIKQWEAVKSNLDIISNDQLQSLHRKLTNAQLLRSIVKPLNFFAKGVSFASLVVFTPFVIAYSAKILSLDIPLLLAPLLLGLPFGGLAIIGLAALVLVTCIVNEGVMFIGRYQETQLEKNLAELNTIEQPIPLRNINSNTRTLHSLQLKNENSKTPKPEPTVVEANPLIPQSIYAVQRSVPESATLESHIQPPVLQDADVMPGSSGPSIVPTPSF